MNSHRTPAAIQHRSNGAGRSRLIIALAVVLAVAVAAGWWGMRRLSDPSGASAAGQAESLRPYHPPSTDGYVGSETCARCHGEIAESFQTHPMSRSIMEVDLADADATMPRDETRIVGSRRVYDVEVRDETMIHHERMFDAEGEPIYDDAHPVAYVVGSGQVAKSYLHQRDDLLFMSPLNWYSQKQRWNMAPSYTPEDPRRFSRRVTDDCLACHAGRVAPVGRSLDKYATPAFHEMAIGCENCHGPGADHVAFRDADRIADGATDPIVNPATLDPARREAVCYQCHLIAEVRLTRHGRSHFDFRPGQRLEDVWTILDAPAEVTADGRSRSVHHVQQMRESRCFLESDGAMGCISCHDPHRAPDVSEKIAFYRARCLNCHQETSCTATSESRRAESDSCIVCHMPARDSSNISHVTQTDHRILRTPDLAATGATGRRKRPALAFFDDMGERLNALEQDRATALAAWVRGSKSEQPLPPETSRNLLRVVEVVPEDGVALNVLGSIASRNGRNDRAAVFHERARAMPESEEVALSSLLDIYYAGGDREKALATADRLLEIDPYDAKVYALRADLLASLGRIDEGIASAERALELNPTLTPVREWLVRAYAVAGRTEEQLRQEHLLERMQNARPPK